MRKYVLLLATSAVIVLAALACVGQASAAADSLNVSGTFLDDYIRPGGKTTLVVDLQNPTSSKIYDIDLSFSSAQGITVTPAEHTVDNIVSMANQSVALEVSASESTPAGTYYFEITAKYHIGGRNEKENELTVWIPIVVRSAPLLKVEGLGYDADVIEPGSDVTVSFDVKNYGDGLAKDVVVSLDQTAGFFNTDLNEKYVGDVAVNGSSSISFNLTINQDLSVGSYTIPIMLSYKDGERKEAFSEIEYAGIKVYGNINLITTLDSQDAVVGGSSGEMEIKIANAGTMEVQFLQLNVLESSVLEDLVPSSIYIGSLKSDDYDTERISFTVSENIPSGTYPVSLQLAYKDPFGSEFTETKTVDLRVLSTGALGGNFELPVWQVALVVVAAALIVYYVLRKRRK